MSLFLGHNRISESELTLPTKILNRHVGLVGQTGSGKTVGLKIIIEEAALAGIPAVIMDPQGDLSQLIMGVDVDQVAANGGDAARAQKFSDMVEVRVWTPVRSKGLPICLNPFVAPSESLDAEQKISSWDLMAAGFTSIAGFDLTKPAGAEIKSYLVTLLELSSDCEMLPKNFYQLADLVEVPHKLRTFSGMSATDFESRIVDLIPDSAREKLARRFRGQETGVNHLLFTLGTPLDFDTMCTPCEDGKVPINIIYMNTLSSQDLKENFLLEVGRRLYDWTIRQKPKGDETKMIFAVDEVHPFMPPHPKNPPPKAILEMLAKQGRKFGLCCIFATQNISSVDYKIFGQAQTLCIGQFTKPQDIKKVKALLTIGNAKNTSMADELPKLKPGSFQIVSNLAFDEPQQVKFRWLYSTHQSGTLSEDDIEEYISDGLRACIERISSGEKMGTNLPEIGHDGETKDQEDSLSDDGINEVDILEESSEEEQDVSIDDQIEEDDQSFEMNLLGGFTLLKDSKDPLSVMLGVTNILTTLVLLWSSYLVASYSMRNEIVSIPLLLGLGISMLAAGVLISEILADGELAVVKKIRQRARPLQYLSLLWLWVLWFLLLSDQIPLDELIMPVEVVQTMMTAFVILEFSHRIKIGNIVLPKGKTISNLFSSSIQSVKTVVTTTELNELRNTSEQLFSSFRLVLDGIVAITLISILSGWDTIHIFSSESWMIRLLAIYAAMFMSQIITRIRTA
jgi:hypothetical protein